MKTERIYLESRVIHVLTELDRLNLFQRFQGFSDLMDFFQPSNHSAMTSADSVMPLMPNVLKVFLENGQTKSFKYDSSTTVQVLTLPDRFLFLFILEIFPNSKVCPACRSSVANTVCINVFTVQKSGLVSGSQL